MILKSMSIRLPTILFTFLRGSWQVNAAFASASRWNNGGNSRSFSSAIHSATHMDTNVVSASSSYSSSSNEAMTDITKGLTDRSFGGIPYVMSNPTSRYQVVFVLGGPGAGKGTQCDRLIENYPDQVHHFSVGELLRNAEGPQKEMIDSYLVAGKIVPVEVSLGLLEQAMGKAVGSEKARGSTVCLVDGFPRNFDNLEGWENLMSECSDVLSVFLFECPVEELERRILSRGETSGRSDDNVESARKRFTTFEKDTMPVVQSLEENDVNVVRIKGDRPLDQVWKATEESMNDIIKNYVLNANRQLLDAISNKDLDQYAALCDIDGDESTMKEAFESELLSDGIEEQKTAKHESIISNAEITIYGETAVVSYDRIIRSTADNCELSNMRETRTWNNQGTGWKNVHFVRTPK